MSVALETLVADKRRRRPPAHAAIRPIFAVTLADHFSTKVSINTFVSYCIRDHRYPKRISSCVSEQSAPCGAVLPGHFDRGPAFRSLR
jgi:hypothetical protein